MTDNMNFEVNLEYSANGAEARIAELANLITELQNANGALERSDAAWKQNAATINSYLAEIGNLKQQLAGVSGEVDGVAKAAYTQTTAFSALVDSIDSVSSAYRTLKQEQAAIGTAPVSPAYGNFTDPKSMSTQQLEGIVAADAAKYVDIVRASKEELAARNTVISQAKQATEAASQAQAQYNQVLAALEMDRVTADMTAAEAASTRLAAAQREYAQASQVVADANAKEGASAAQIAAQTKALQRVRAEESNLRKAQAAEKKQAAAEEEAAAKRANQAIEEQVAAEQRLRDAQKDLNFAENTAEMNKAERAAALVTRRKKELAEAEENLAKAQKEGDPAKMRAALDQQTQATKNLTAATRQQVQANESFEASQMNMRYGLYDVSRTMAVVSGAMITAGTGATMAFANWESGMSQVYQTNMDKPVGELRELEESLKDLSSTVPITLEELQGLATLAGQLDVSGDIGDFAETMSQFGILSDTVSAEEAAESIAKLVNVMGGADHVGAVTNVDDAYRAFATSIAQVGVNTAATDQQILHTASNLGLVASQAGFTGDEVVGLSAAMASFGIPAERSRSAMQDWVSVVNQGLGGVGVERLEAMADMMGLNVEQVRAMWDADPMGFFQEFLSSLKDAEAAGGNYTTILSQMGLEGKRAVPVLSTMANGFQQIDHSLEESKKGWEEYDDEMSIFNQRMNQVTDDLSAMWQILLNQIQLSAASIGEALAPALKDLVQWLGEALIKFREWSSTDTGQFWIETAVKVGAVVTVLALVVGGLTAAAAASIALKTAFSGTWLGTAFLRLMGISKAAWAGKAGMDAAALSAHRFRLAMAAAARAAGFLILIDFAIRLLFDFKNTVYETASAVYFFAQPFHDLGRSIVTGLANGLRPAVNLMQLAANAIIQSWNSVRSALGMPPVVAPPITSLFDAAVQSAIQGIDASMNNWHEGMNRLREWAGIPSGLGSAIADGMKDQGSLFEDYLNLFEDSEEDFAGAGEDLGNALGDGMGKGADKAKQELRTLVDYASDLSSVFSRAFDLRFQTGLTRDDIWSSFHAMQDAITEAEKKVRDLQQSIRDLRADLAGNAASISQAQYFLSVAVEYGDTLRAQELEAELAKLQAERAKQEAELADQKRNLADAEDEASRSLTGNSKAAIANRKTMSELVQTYAAHLEALASSGMSQRDLAKESQRLKKEFIQQALAMGYNEKEVMRYAAAFDDMTTIIQAIPRNVTIEFDGNPALTAIREFVAQANEELSNLGGNLPGGGGGGLGSDLGGGGGMGAPEGLGKIIGEGMKPEEKTFKDLKKAWERAYDDVVSHLARKQDMVDVNKDFDRAYDTAVKAIQRRQHEVDKQGWTPFDHWVDGLNIDLDSPWMGIIADVNRRSGDFRKAGSNAAKAFNDGFGSPLGAGVNSTFNKVTGTAEPSFRKAGRDSANALESEVMSGVARVASGMVTKGGEAGTGYRTGLINAIGTVGSAVGASLSTGLNAQRVRVNTIGQNTGAGYRKGFNSSATSGLGSSVGSTLVKALNSQKSRVGNIGKETGRGFANGLRSTIAGGVGNAAAASGRAAGDAFLAAMRSRLAGKTIVNFQGQISKMGGSARTKQMYTGGFTGSGQKYQPADVQVHKGEYVLDRSMVNQRTGLPNENALGLIHRGSQATPSTYQSPGRNRGTMVVEFSAQDRKLIAKSQQPVYVNIGPDRVSRANDYSSRTNARRGSN